MKSFRFFLPTVAMIIFLGIIRVENLTLAIEDEAVLNRIYDSSIDYIIITAQFNTLKPEEIALLVLGRNVPPIRLDLDSTGVTTIMEDYSSLRSPLPPLMIKVYEESGGPYIYIINLTNRRKVDPDHPLSKLTLRKFDNIPVKLLLENAALERISGLLDRTHFGISFTAEVSGYAVSLFSQSLKSSQHLMPLPRRVPGKPGFVMMALPDWKTSLKVTGQSSLRDMEEVRDHLDRKNHLKSWRGIWPDKETLDFFNSFHKLPVDEESIVFHPWNQRFVRLQNKFGADCSVPGISAFLVGGKFFYLFARVVCEGDVLANIVVSKDDVEINLSLNEVATMLNICSEVARLNNTWAKLDGNYIQGLALLLPEREKYVFLDSEALLKYRENNPEQPYDAKRAREEISHAIIMIKNLPKKSDSESRTGAASRQKTERGTIVYQMFEKYLLIFKFLLVPETLDDNKQREIKNGLAGLNFQRLPSPERKDLEECRTEFVELLDNPPPSDSDAVAKRIVELHYKLMPVLVDFEIDGRRAKQDGYAELAEDIDRFLNLHQNICLAGKLEKPKPTRPVARCFVEYFVIYDAMHKAKKRPVLDQTALLAMQPNQLKSSVERSEFLDLHEALLLLSRSVTKQDKDLRINEHLPFEKFLRILGKFEITDEEIITAGGEKLVKIISDMRELLK